MTPFTALRWAAGAELVSLAVLLLNLATAHRPQVAAAVGPLHGCAYLFVILFAVLSTRAPRIRLTAAVPGIGGLLALRQLARADPP